MYVAKKSSGKEEEAMKDMKKVKIYFKKLIYSELIGMIRENIGKAVWNNNVARKCYGVTFDYNDDELVDIDVVTAMIIIKASRQGMFDEFDYETKTEIVQFIMNEFKELTYKTFHEICMDYRDVDVKCDIYEFMRTKAAMMKKTYSHHSVYDMRCELIRDTEMRFEHDLIMDCHRKELLRNYIWDIAFSVFPMKKKAA